MSESSQQQQRQDQRQVIFAALKAALDEPSRRFIRRLIGIHHAEDDIVQDAFFALYLNLERLEAAHIRPFLFRVIRNRSYDILRKQGRYHVVGFDNGLEHTIHADDLPHDETTHWILLHIEVQRAIEQLPELQRQAMLLYAVEDMSYAEVAAAMNTSTGTIKSRIHHARKMLKRLVRPETLAALSLTDSDSNSSPSQLHQEK